MDEHPGAAESAAALTVEIARVVQARHIAGLAGACAHCLPAGAVAWPCGPWQLAAQILHRLSPPGRAVGRASLDARQSGDVDPPLHHRGGPAHHSLR